MSLIVPTIPETLLNFAKGIGGFCLKHWRIIGILIAFVVLIWVFYRAFHREPKLNEQEIQQAQTAIEQKNDQKLREILTNSDVREAQIDANVAYSKAQTANVAAESHEKYANMNTDQLAAEIERRKNQ